jgi:hypothetical protein
MGILTRMGSRKLIGFFACLLVGGVMIYVAKLDTTAATFICALYASYVGGNAARHIAAAVSAFRPRPRPDGGNPTEPAEAADGRE